MRNAAAISFVSALSVLFGAVAVSAQEASPQDKQFVAEANSGGTLEVRLGEYASFNAASGDVKKFGEQMVGDHDKAHDKLKTVAYDQSIEMPKRLNEDDQRTLDRLEKLKGADFDKAYMAQMVVDHEKDIAVFEKEVSGGSNVWVKAFAEKFLPTLQHHLQMAREIKAKL